MCAACHDDTGFTPPQENLPPPYYGTAYTRVSNPSNDVAIANTNENWSIGDFRGLDNDGDTLYDMNDPACWLASGLWGGASDTGGGWAQLSWFGSFRSFGPPGGWIYHAEHGWLYPVGASNAAIWLWSARQSWMWTNQTIYPFLWSDSQQAWLWYYRNTGSGSGGWFYDYGASQVRWL